MVEMDEILRPHQATERLLAKLEAARDYESNVIHDIAAKSCVYLTGSLARYEAAAGSDIDLFVVDCFLDDPNRPAAKQELSIIEEARLLAWLDAVRSAAKFRPFSRGGYFVRKHSFDSMIAKIGDASDDADNAFTARMLLLINSLPFLNESIYYDLRDKSLDAYWYNVSDGQPKLIDPEKPFFPVMLINDLRPWWSSVALNFERDHRLDREPVSEFDHLALVDRRIANLKLRYPRMLAVYSVLIGILAASGENGLTRAETVAVLEATPVDRLQIVGAQSDARRHLTEEIVTMYNSYLRVMDRPKGELRMYFSDHAVAKQLKETAYEFHDKVSALFLEVGRHRSLFSYCII